MRAISRLVLVAALLIGLAPATVSAQRWTIDWGVNGGASWYSQMLDEQAAGPEGARFRAGWLVGSQLTFWAAPRFGLRANLTYTDRPLVLDGSPNVPGLTDGDVLFDNVNLWSGSVDALLRLGAVPETWIGMETLPYVALGLGRKWINPAGDDWVCPPVGETAGNECAIVNPQTGPVALAERNVWMGLVGLGADFRVSPRMSIRAEVNDRIYRPEVWRVQGEAPPAGTAAAPAVAVVTDENTLARTVHEIGVQVGLHFLMGLRAPPPVAVAPLPPAPPPPPPPPPAPEPPREDEITVCVIDPAAPGGVRMQTAVFRHEQRDTVVMVDGQRRPIREAVTVGVPLARDASWYVQGEPLVLRVGAEQIRFLPYQTATVIDPARIVFIGNIGGFPVYADRDEIADVLPQLQEARAGRTDVELGTLLAERRQIRDTVQGVSFMYVPLDPYGCVFQPVQRVVDVRKGK
jgi:hypothetical protein